MKPLIGVVAGDPNGVGPELTAKLLAADEVRRAARVVVIGDKRVVGMGADVAGVPLALAAIADTEALIRGDFDSLRGLSARKW